VRGNRDVDANKLKWRARENGPKSTWLNNKQMPYNADSQDSTVVCHIFVERQKEFN
jgi:hypothetical protein